jgi:hypothetical protein
MFVLFDSSQQLSLSWRTLVSSCANVQNVVPKEWRREDVLQVPEECFAIVFHFDSLSNWLTESMVYSTSLGLVGVELRDDVVHFNVVNGFIVTTLVSN